MTVFDFLNSQGRTRDMSHPGGVAQWEIMRVQSGSRLAVFFIADLEIDDTSAVVGVDVFDSGTGSTTRTALCGDVCRIDETSKRIEAGATNAAAMCAVDSIIDGLLEHGATQISL